MNLIRSLVIFCAVFFVVLFSRSTFGQKFPAPMKGATLAPIKVAVYPKRWSLPIFSKREAPANSIALGISGPDKKGKSSVDIQKGWSRTLKVGANVSLGVSDNWIGQLNGNSTTLGLSFDGSFSYGGEQSDGGRSRQWQNTLRILEASTQNPSLPRWVKSSDEITIESMYRHFLEKHTWARPLYAG